MKKLVLIAIIIMLLTGCGRVKNAKEIVKYANHTYGKAELVDTTFKSKKEANYNLKDKENNFNYTCSSYITNFNLDGTDFFSHPETTCTFDTEYKKYINNIINQKFNMNLVTADKYNDGKKNI